jgi:hypothetical protein
VEAARSTFYAQRTRRARPATGRRGRPPVLDDGALLAQIRTVIAASPFQGEGHRKIWARLRAQSGVRTSMRRVLRVMREADLLSPARRPAPVVERAHEGTIVTAQPNAMWGTDATLTVTVRDGTATIFAPVDHCTAECVGIHAAPHGDRFEALEPLRQGVREHFGGLTAAAAQGPGAPPRPWQRISQPRLSSRDRVSRDDVVAGVRPTAGRQRLHRTLLPQAEGSSCCGGVTSRPSRRYDTRSSPSRRPTTGSG